SEPKLRTLRHRIYRLDVLDRINHHSLLRQQPKLLVTERVNQKLQNQMQLTSNYFLIIDLNGLEKSSSQNRRTFQKLMMILLVDVVIFSYFFFLLINR